MIQKLPYYMAYPMPLLYDDERTERMDLEYLKSLYPEIPGRILPYVEEECDRMEYDGSMIYDEYPDKLQLRLMCSRICGNVRREERHFLKPDNGKSGENVPETPADPGQMESCFRMPARDGWLEDLVQVMLYQELYKRRCDHRRRCRRLY